MNQVMIDIWPFLFPPMLLVIGWLFRQIFLLRSELDVSKKTIEGLKVELNGKIEGLEGRLRNAIESLEKTIDSIQKRQDSHSKKQDDILDRISSMEKEVLKETGSVRADISELKSEVRSFSNLILASDNGIKIPRN